MIEPVVVHRRAGQVRVRGRHAPSELAGDRNVVQKIVVEVGRKREARGGRRSDAAKRQAHRDEQPSRQPENLPRGRRFEGRQRRTIGATSHGNARRDGRAQNAIRHQVEANEEAHQQDQDPAQRLGDDGSEHQPVQERRFLRDQAPHQARPQDR